MFCNFFCIFCFCVFLMFFSSLLIIFFYFLFLILVLFCRVFTFYLLSFSYFIFVSFLIFFSNSFVYICIKLLFFLLNIFGYMTRTSFTSIYFPKKKTPFFHYFSIVTITFAFVFVVPMYQISLVERCRRWRVAAVGCLLLPRGLINNTRKAWHLHISAPTDCLTPLYVKHQFCICCDLHSNSHTRPQTYN